MILTEAELASGRGVIDLGRISPSINSLLETVGCLVDLAPQGVTIRWSLPLDCGLPEGSGLLLQHLTPPSSGGGGEGERWRAMHRYGSLYYRQGPNFVSVRDRRHGLNPAALTLSGTTVTDLINGKASHHQGQAPRGLEDANLVLAGDNSFVFLPVWLRYPPIPSFAV